MNAQFQRVDYPCHTVAIDRYVTVGSKMVEKIELVMTASKWDCEKDHLEHQSGDP